MFYRFLAGLTVCCYSSCMTYQSSLHQIFEDEEYELWSYKVKGDLCGLFHV